MNSIQTAARRIAALLAVVVLCGMCAVVCRAEDSADMIGRVRQGVVQIGAFDSYTGEGGTGTGFGVGAVGKDTDLFLTNWHVVTGDNGKVLDEVYIFLDNAYSIENGYIVLNEDAIVRCEVLFTTTGYPDFAIIRALEPIHGIKALPLMSSTKARPGATVYALGYPSATDYGTTHATIDDMTVTTGVISKLAEVGMIDNSKCVVHDAHINHGNSGGPLVTKDGAVIGINTYTIEDDAYSYAVFIDYAMEKMDEMGLYYELYGENGGAAKQTGPSAGVIGAGAAVLAAAGAGVVAMRKKGAKAPADGGAQQPAGMAQPSSGYSICSAAGQVTAVPPGGLVIGRDPAVCNLCMADGVKGVSRRHCRLEVNSGTLMLTDLGSSYGTVLNGQRLTPNYPAPVPRGSSFWLGDASNHFTVQ